MTQRASEALSGVSRWNVHALADLVFVAMARSRSLFEDGFGDTGRLADLVGEARRYPEGRAPARIHVRWSRGRYVAGAELRHGWFESPFARFLPREGRRARIELLLPAASGHRAAPVCLMLAATGEQGFARRRAWARALLRFRIGALVLENPYYGARRAHGQRGAAVRTVADQFAMNLATVDEARALLAWLRLRGHERVGVTGYSQGGIMAAFAAALVDFPVAAVPRGAGCCATSIFTATAFSKALNWQRLARDRGGLAHARDYLRRCLEPIDLRLHPAPRLPTASIIVAASADGVVPPKEVLALHRHWRGSELRWLAGGHVTSAVLDRRAQVLAIADAFERLGATFAIA